MHACYFKKRMYVTLKRMQFLIKFYFKKTKLILKKTHYLHVLGSIIQINIANFE